jgi:hypothetical protein
MKLEEATRKLREFAKKRKVPFTEEGPYNLAGLEDPETKCAVLLGASYGENFNNYECNLVFYFGYNSTQAYATDENLEASVEWFIASRKLKLK